MFWVTRGLPMFVELGLLVYCLIDCIQTPEDRIRNLRKGIWILLIIVIPLAGGIAWLFAGRPRPVGRRAEGAGSGRGWFGGQQPRVIGPDDDPEFLAQLGRATGQRRGDDDEQQLSAWEQELRAGNVPDDLSSEAPQDDVRRDGDEGSTR